MNLTASHDVLNRIVIPHLDSFKQTYPCIDLRILSSARLANLSSRQADIALRLTPKPPDYLVGKKVLPLRHGIYANDVTSQLACVCNHFGLARLPCYIGDKATDLLRLDLSLTPSTWAVWVLSHVDLRSTARVRACRDFLVDVIEQERNLIKGLNSRYFT